MVLSLEDLIPISAIGKFFENCTVRGGQMGGSSRIRIDPFIK